MVSISQLMEQHDKEKEEPPKLSKKEKQKLKKLQKKLEKEAQIRKAEEDEMDREIKVAQKNIVTFRTKWKEIRMEKGQPEFKEYMMEHWCLFDHLMDKKDQLIKVFTEELEHAERTRVLSFKDHVLSVDKLLNDFYGIIQNLKLEMETNKINLLETHNIKTQNLQDEIFRKDENMRLILFLVDKGKQEDYELWGAELLAAFEEEVSKNRSEMEIMVAQMERKMNRLWKSYKTSLEEYIKESKSVLKLSEPLSEKVKADDFIILEAKKKLKYMKTMIESARYKASKQPMSIELKDLRAERAELYDQYTKEKKRLSKLQEELYRRLQSEITSNQEVNDYFYSIENTGNKIFKMFEVCRTLETTKEQQLTARSETVTRGGAERTNKMFKFWKRIGRIEMTTTLMRVECKKLKKINKELQIRVKNVLKSSSLQTIRDILNQCTLRLF